MASKNEGGHVMTDSHRNFLRKQREFLKENLMVDDVLLLMSDIFQPNDEETIKAETTSQARTLKLLSLLPLRGGEAFTAFIVATYKTQEWLGKELARKAGIDLNTILSAVPDEGNHGMEKVHRDILRKYLPQFCEKLNAKEMVDSLKKAGIITPGNQRSFEDISEEQINPKKVEKLITLLPKLGPKAFGAFFDALRINQLQFAHDIERLVKQDYPNVKLGTTIHQESTQDSMPNQAYSLSTPCSELPEDILELCAKCLDRPSELLENDWKSFYQLLKLPEGKEDVIARRDGSPTRQVLNAWIDMHGKKANVSKLLEVLEKCKQGGLVYKIEQKLGVELPEQQCASADIEPEQQRAHADIVDGVQNMNVRGNRKGKPIRYVKDIPQDLKSQLVDRLNGVDKAILETMLNSIKMERCYVQDGNDFLEKIRDRKTRIFFRELRKQEQCDLIVRWMRKTFPAGSTGPMKSEDNLKACEMNYGFRLVVTRSLTANDCWKTLASHKDINLTKIDIDLIEMKKAMKDPSEAVLSHWEVSNTSTVGTMYDLLVDCGFNQIADNL
ncbi:uncharacterized protein LOC114518814 [Dendronephthya gigantea]|uniref:uncharacterized protein LOC114518814 n=1 Tax=Dendronephthya gigantea TaxID=151771 RepID=UPI00106C5B8E|nr:uncharacterized protein LOC114518814 [Dendronephthya gigantea]